MPRKPNPFIEFVKVYRKNNPNISYKDALKNAGKEYKKMSGTHKMSDGTVMSGSTHNKNSKPVKAKKSKKTTGGALDVDDETDAKQSRNGRAKELRIYKKLLPKINAGVRNGNLDEKEYGEWRKSANILRANSQKNSYAKKLKEVDRALKTKKYLKLKAKKDNEALDLAERILKSKNMATKLAKDEKNQLLLEKAMKKEMKSNERENIARALLRITLGSNGKRKYTDTQIEEILKAKGRVQKETVRQKYNMSSKEFKLISEEDDKKEMPSTATPSKFTESSGGTETGILMKSDYIDLFTQRNPVIKAMNDATFKAYFKKYNWFQKNKRKVKILDVLEASEARKFVAEFEKPKAPKPLTAEDIAKASAEAYKKLKRPIKKIQQRTITRIENFVAKWNTADYGMDTYMSKSLDVNTNAKIDRVITKVEADVDKLDEAYDPTDTSVANKDLRDLINEVNIVFENLVKYKDRLPDFLKAEADGKEQQQKDKDKARRDKEKAKEEADREKQKKADAKQAKIDAEEAKKQKKADETAKQREAFAKSIVKSKEAEDALKKAKADEEAQKKKDADGGGGGGAKPKPAPKPKPVAVSPPSSPAPTPPSSPTPAPKPTTIIKLKRNIVKLKSIPLPEIGSQKYNELYAKIENEKPMMRTYFAKSGDTTMSKIANDFLRNSGLPEVEPSKDNPYFYAQPKDKSTTPPSAPKPEPPPKEEVKDAFEAVKEGREFFDDIDDSGVRAKVLKTAKEVPKKVGFTKESFLVYAGEPLSGINDNLLEFYELARGKNINIAIAEYVGVSPEELQKDGVGAGEIGALINDINDYETNRKANNLKDTLNTISKRLNGKAKKTIDFFKQTSARIVELDSDINPDEKFYGFSNGGKGSAIIKEITLDPVKQKEALDFGTDIKERGAKTSKVLDETDMTIPELKTAGLPLKETETSEKEFRDKYGLKKAMSESETLADIENRFGYHSVATEELEKFVDYASLPRNKQKDITYNGVDVEFNIQELIDDKYGDKYYDEPDIKTKIMTLIRDAPNNLMRKIRLELFIEKVIVDNLGNDAVKEEMKDLKDKYGKQGITGGAFHFVDSIRNAINGFNRVKKNVKRGFNFLNDAKKHAENLTHHNQSLGTRMKNAISDMRRLHGGGLEQQDNMEMNITPIEDEDLVGGRFRLMKAIKSGFGFMKKHHENGNIQKVMDAIRDIKSKLNELPKYGEDQLKITLTKDLDDIKSGLN